MRRRHRIDLHRGLVGGLRGEVVVGDHPVVHPHTPALRSLTVLLDAPQPVGASRAAEMAGDRANAAEHERKLVELAKEADTARPELTSARAFARR